MAHESESQSHESGSSSRIGLYQCKLGQECVHDIVGKTLELFNLLKTTSSTLQRTSENEARRIKIRELLDANQNKFDALRRHYDIVNEICSGLSYMQPKSLIPFKDDPDNIEQIEKHRRNLSVVPNAEMAREKEELLKQLTGLDERLRQITFELREFIYEINTMLHVSK